MGGQEGTPWSEQSSVSSKRPIPDAVPKCPKHSKLSMRLTHRTNGWVLEFQCSVKHCDQFQYVELGTTRCQ